MNKPYVGVTKSSTGYQFLPEFHQREMAKSVLGAKWNQSRRVWEIPSTPMCPSKIK